MTAEHTIRTWDGLLYGRFEAGEDAHAAMGRIRRSEHREAVRGAQVVPLLDGVTPHLLHPGWLSDDAESPSALVEIPGQPDGIEDDSRDLPDPIKAAERIDEYISATGDGLYDVSDGHPLYGRDLNSVTRAVKRLTELDRHSVDELSAERIRRIQAGRDALPADERQRREAADAPLLRIQLAHSVGRAMRLIAELDAVVNARNAAASEVERLTGHSKTLNAVAWKLTAALGDIPHGQEWTEGNPVELAERLIAERDAARFERDNMRVTIRQAFGAGDDAWTVVANSPHV